VGARKKEKRRKGGEEKLAPVLDSGKVCDPC